MDKKRGKIIAGIEILLLVSMSFAVSYELSQAFRSDNTIISETSGFSALGIYKQLLKIVFSDKNLVSAEDLQVNTCLVGKNGSICQEYSTASQCNSQCSSACVSAQRKDISSCKLGTCYDKTEGTCQTQAPMAQCQNFGGQWFDDPNGNILQCKRGCCLLGDETSFITEQQCKRQSQLLGIETNFKGEIKTELACISEAKKTEEGACLFVSDFEKTCKFTNKADCLKKKGEFRGGYLCSNPSFETNCTKQSTTSCVVGKDEIYWFDSCGNKENIYEGSLPSQKDKAWNNGVVLSKNQSCSVGGSANPLLNQATCGNCDYFSGSICGPKTTSQKLSDTSQNYVCKNLGCIDSSGKKRANGESWCAYDSAIGVDEKNNRGTDVPGSRHFREICSNGEIRIEPCQDYRNDICVQSDVKLESGGTFSTAGCKINQWQVCLDYNSQVAKSNANNRDDVIEQRNDQCTDNEDCFIKNITIADNFKFQFCTPKYAPGFDLADNGKGAQQICSMATQKCTVVYVKGFSGWSCKQNCGCATGKFAEQMNNFCSSLGDCGAKVNVAGDLTQNYRVSSTSGKASKLSQSYLNEISKYSQPIPGKYAETSLKNLTELIENVGIPEDLGSALQSEGKKGLFSGSGMFLGLAGVGLLLATNAGWLPTPLHLFTGPLAGALIGASVVSLLMNLLGVKAPPGIAFGLMAAGALAGVLLVTSFSGHSIGALAPLYPFAIPLAIIVVVIIVVMAILGVGKIKKVTYTFSCNAWQPPVGGAKCDQCGKDGLPCSKYTCQSLGQTCEFINEGTSLEKCVANDPKDINPPQIKPNTQITNGNYTYSSISDNGFTVKSNSNDGCIGSYTPIMIGITTNKVSQCRMDIEHTSSFEDMENDFGDSLFDYNHTMPINIPSVESLGLPGYDPNTRADYNLYIRCQDKSGHKNEKEYNIKFCVKPGIDRTAPIVTARDPDFEYIRYGESELNASIFTNEPSECKWSSQDKDYDLMENNLQCANEIEDQEIFGWKCDTQFPVDSSSNALNYYIRCQDQPWLTTDSNGNSQIVVNEGQDEDGNNITRIVDVEGERQRNVMSESYVFNIKKSQSQLKIDSVTPNGGTIKVAVQPVSVNFTVRTSGGVDGKPLCSFFSGGSWIPFFNTWDSVHTQTLEGFYSGAKKLDVYCEDQAGNSANASSKFNILLDTDVPIVTRVFSTSNSLTVITDENSQCYISTNIPDENPCNFDITNATLMQGSGVVHTSSFNPKKTSFIKCKDSFGNTPGDCSIQIRGAFT